MSEFTIYDLSRNWFDWCFENTDLIRPNHTALYFFAVEHCNRLGWKEKFGLPTQMTMDAIGIKNWRTYSQTFEDLVKWGFFEVKERSKNQYSATVIAIVKNTKANTKALSKATQKHSQKQCKSIVVINKPINKDTIIQEYDFVSKEFLCFYEWLKYKKEIKDEYKSEIGIKKAYSHLINLSKNNPSEAQKIIDTSMANNWKGLFELKQNNGKQNNRPTTAELHAAIEFGAGLAAADTDGK